MKKQLLAGLSLIGAAALMMSSPAFASAFQLFEYDGRSMGDAGAGFAAEADSASTNFSNAAGLTRLRNPQIVVSADQIWSKNNFTGTSTNNNLLRGVGAPYSQSGTSWGGASNLVPAFHYGSPINDRWAFGFSVTAPFGLDTEFPTGGFQRYAATLSSIRTYNISPSLAYKFNEKFSGALGFDAMRMEAKLNSVIGVPGTAQALGLPATATDTLFENKGSGWGYGWHAGLLYQFTPNTRLGFSYRSQVSQKLSGTSTLIGPLAPNGSYNQSSGFQAGVKLPPTTALSLYHAFNPQWALMGSVIYTRWSTVQTINLTGLQPPFGSSSTTAGLTQNFRNTWRYALGATYTLNDCWKFRAGIGFDQNPTVDTYRNVRLPDGNRTLYSVGASYQVVKNVGLDLGYTYVSIKNGVVNNTANGVRMVGSSSNRANLVGLQLTWDIV